MLLSTRFARDPQFALAAAAAPLAWLTLAAALPTTDPSWAARDPLRFASLVLAWPLLEELVFRGWVQPRLLRTAWGARENWGVTTANVATSLLFAAAHLPLHAPAWAAATLAPSLVFGYFRDRHASVVPAVALHSFYNLGWFLLFGR